VNRLGTILIPLLAGFLITVAVVSWRSPWWHRDPLLSDEATPARIEARPANLRIVQVHVSAGPRAGFTAAPAAARTSAPRAAAPVLRESPASRIPRGARTNE